ncbi:MAG: ABC transporter ATP-binding protein [Deltaproteobacteria bacterium]|nr:ABC transporter ATP-binding protein [Deltaproteobacteria bacterium]
MEQDTLLSVEGLKTYCYTRAGIVKAVDGVSFSVNRGDALGIVGESGCGKSMTCNSITRLIPQPAARTVAGKVIFEGEDLLQKSDREMRQVRGKRISMILQDPLMSLNPVYTVGNQVAESFTLHGEKLSAREIRERVIKVLTEVNIPSAAQRLKDYPFQFSGGMRQRTVAAMALAASPSLLIADEPTTALDVTIQDQFLRLLNEMRQRTQMGLILVTHDLGIVAEVCNRIVVMYAGRIVETGGIKEVFLKPLHPYTEALLKALPTIGNRHKRLFQIQGEPPNLLDLPEGCSFRPRCHRADERCQDGFPPMVDVGEGRQVACWRLVKGEG